MKSFHTTLLLFLFLLILPIKSIGSFNDDFWHSDKNKDKFNLTFSFQRNEWHQNQEEIINKALSNLLLSDISIGDSNTFSLTHHFYCYTEDCENVTNYTVRLINLTLVCQEGNKPTRWYFGKEAHSIESFLDTLLEDLLEDTIFNSYPYGYSKDFKIFNAFEKNWERDHPNYKIKTLEMNSARNDDNVKVFSFIYPYHAKPDDKQNTNDIDDTSDPDDKLNIIDIDDTEL